MNASTYSVNQTGLREIAEFLGENFRQAVESGEGPAYFTASMLGAWASDVETSIEEGNGAQFEISAAHSVTGKPVIGRVSDAGLDAREIEE